MDSLTYKRLANALDDGLREVNEQLEIAMLGELDADEVQEAVGAARRKIADYEESLSRFGDDAGKRDSFVERFAQPLDYMRRALTQLS
jgi:hypothetical protein